MNKGSLDNVETKIPFMWRIRAWWHGYDLEDVKAKLSQAGDNQSGNMSLNSSGSPKKSKKSFIDQQESEDNYHFEDKPAARYPVDYDDADEDIEFYEEDHVAVKAVWDTERAHVAQVLWGDGFCGPGGPENIIKMTEPLNINSRRSSMVIGAGLGGPVRALQKEYNVPIDGYESSERLAADGMEMSLEAGVAQDAPIIHFDCENITSFSRRYDRIYSKEATFHIANKTQLINTIYDHLKKDGLLLLTEYVLSEDADQSSVLYKKWRNIEPYTPRPVTAATMKSYLENANFSIRTNEDITDFYLELILAARTHARDIIKTMEADEINTDDVNSVTILKYMHNEAVFWDTRAKLMRRGDLKIVRFLGRKAS